MNTTAMNTTAMKITENKNLTAMLRSSLVIVALAAISGCGQKGPLILDQVPVDQTQAPLENSTNQIPLAAASPTAVEETAAKPER
ncbi:MAG: putative small lipoprotein YifL [Arenicella sp.]|jgi:predicted small lipoprotein YifL